MNKKKIAMIVMSLAIAGSLTGCGIKPYDKPEFVEVTPSQTAILLPLEGKTSEQSKMQSEEYLKQNLVPNKRVQILHKWQQEGRFPGDGKYVPTNRLIIVERKPVTRNWSNETDTGTSAKKEGIKAETRESIAFSVNINATAQIDEPNAVKFLYRYNGQTLETIMDTEIRSRINTKFVEECAKYSLSDENASSSLLANKGKIMEIVRKDSMDYFAERGITITALGISGDLSYSNPAIQEAIDNKFKAEKEKESAQAKADAIKTQASTLNESIRLRELDLKQQELNNQLEAIKKWNGSVSQIQGGQGMMFNIPLNPTK